MALADLFVQLLNGLAHASTLFLLASGLSLIFGVTRVVNFAHGSLYMLGLYVGIWTFESLGGEGLSFWVATLVATVAIALLGAIVEIFLLRRIYAAPELFQLLATFGVVLVLKDVTLLLWGPEDVLGPRALGLDGAMEIGTQSIPEYDLFLIALGPIVLALLLWLFHRTRFGILVRAATEDRQMVQTLGVNQSHLFTSVFVLGSALAGLAGALQMPREPASLGLDTIAITDAFVVVVIGGLGSILGAFVAAGLIGVAKAICVSIGTVESMGLTVNFSKLTLVIEFAIMAGMLVFRPWGLFGKPLPARDALKNVARIFVPQTRFWWIGLTLIVVLALAPLIADEYFIVLLTDVLIFGLFAVSLHLLMSTGGMASFGHAMFFGVGAYAAALVAKSAGISMVSALLLATLISGTVGWVIGWFCVRLSGVYLAMLTLAFAQILWSGAFQWDDVTGGSNGVVGVWPDAWAASKATYYLVTLALCGAFTMLVWRIQSSPYGFALRASRDAPRRALAIGIDVTRTQWMAFPLAAGAAGLAGALFAFSKGSISPEVMAIPRSVDALVMVLLGGINAMVGPIVGAAVFTILQDEILRHTEYWRLVLGATVIALVVLFPRGIVGTLAHAWRSRS